MNLSWLVFRYNANAKKIETYDIFNHLSFAESVKNHLQNIPDKNKFEEQLRTELMYYFWHKTEWEVIICPFGEGGEARKIDVYKQVMANWPVFVDYVWKESPYCV